MPEDVSCYIQIKTGLTTTVFGNGTNDGDIGILHTPISSKYPTESAGDSTILTTGYVWHNNKWEAMNGNYDANNVYFSENISLGGTYTTVGNIDRGKTSILSCKGKTVSDVFKSIFDATVDPELGKAPSAALKVTTNTSYEIGSVFTPTVSVRYIPGEYISSWVPQIGSDGTTLNNWNVYISKENKYTTNIPSTTVTKNLDEISAFSTGTYNLSVSVAYTQGSVTKNNKNQDSTIRRKTGTTSYIPALNSITVYRKTFYYVGTEYGENIITPTFMRTTGNGHSSSNSITTSKSLEIPYGTKMVCYAIQGTNRTLKSVIDVAGLNQDIKTRFTAKSLTIPGANNRCSESYTVFYYINESGM